MLVRARLPGIRRLIKKLLLATLIAGSAAFAFALWPVASAYQLRQAVRAGDSVTLDKKVDWSAVRVSLKHSIAELVARGRSEPPADPNSGQKRSMWAGLKLAMAPYFADRFIDTYVTAEGVSKLSAARNSLRAAGDGAGKLVSGDLDAAMAAVSADHQSSRIDRFLAFYNRIIRAQFHSLDHVEFEIADTSTPERRYVSEFRLANLEWKLVSVRVVGAVF